MIVAAEIVKLNEPARLSLFILRYFARNANRVPSENEYNGAIEAEADLMLEHAVRIMRDHDYK